MVLFFCGSVSVQPWASYDFRCITISTSLPLEVWAQLVQEYQHGEEDEDLQRQPVEVLRQNLMPETRLLFSDKLWSLSFIQPFGEPGEGRQDAFYHIDISSAFAQQMALPGSPSKNMPSTLQDAVDHHCRPQYQITTESLSGKTFPETKNQVFCRYGVTMIKQMLEASPIPPRSPEDFLPGADEPLSRLDLLLIPSARRGDHPRIRVKESDPDFGWRVEDGQVGGFLKVVKIYGPDGGARLHGGASSESGGCTEECKRYVHLPTFADLARSLEKLQLKKQEGGGKSGAVPRFTDDGRYIMKKMEGHAHEERTLDEVTPPLWEYWISPPTSTSAGGRKSLISRYYAKLQDPSGNKWVLFENVHTPFKDAFPQDSIGLLDIKGGGYLTIGAGPHDKEVPVQLAVNIQSISGKNEHVNSGVGMNLVVDRMLGFVNELRCNVNELR